MYDELIAALRGPYDSRTDIQLMKQAADAIEELQSDNAALNGTVSNLIEQITELSKPRWIPVTERLPEKTGKYLVCGQWRGKPAEIWVCELIALGKIKGWANEARNPVVTHWMPLPIAPMEE